MTTDPTTSTGPTCSPLATALAALQGELPHIAKDRTANVPTKSGGSYRYSYSDLAAISRELLPLLSKHGLAFMARPTLDEGRLVLAYELMHRSGESRAGVYPLPDRGTPQEVGGAITYARRYCLCAVTGVAPDDDDDAGVAERSARKSQQRASGGQRSAAPDNSDPGESGITAPQVRKLQALYGSAGIADREKKLAFAKETIGREVGSATELTQTEASRVIARLERMPAPAGAAPSNGASS